MTRDQYFAHHRDLCDKALILSMAKNHDYTGDSQPDDLAEPKENTAC